MVKSLVVKNLNKIKKAVPKVESRLKVNVLFNRNGILIKGNEYDSFIADKIFQAVDFGFDVEDAVLLVDENFVLEFVDIKENTRRNNLKDVRARVIGRQGKALKTIENLTGAVLVLHDNVVGVIVDSDNLDITVQSIESIIRGAKHGNAFSYLEKNKPGKDLSFRDDLGLKPKAEKIAREEGSVIADKYLAEEDMGDVK